MKYLSLFTGVGGFELGIERAYELQGMGVEPTNSTNSQSGTSQHGQRPLCIGFSEIDKYANQVFKYRFPNIKNYGDVTKINPTELPDFDLLVGGFPCQAFSVAGKRLGFQDTRGTLFFDIARILAHKRPRHLVLENVKGLLSHDNGKTFQTILKVLTDIGYSVEWQVLNAKDFGVPQNRERIFIVGHLGGFGRRKVFPIRSHDKDSNIQDRKALAVTLRSRYPGNANGDYISDGQALLQDRPESQPNNAIRRTTPTANSRIRRLTPTECERLMSWPDDWTKYGIIFTPYKDIPGCGEEIVIMSDTQRYKMCGNGVVSEVVKAVITRL